MQTAFTVEGEASARGKAGKGLVRVRKRSGDRQVASTLSTGEEKKKKRRARVSVEMGGVTSSFEWADPAGGNWTASPSSWSERNFSDAAVSIPGAGGVAASAWVRDAEALVSAADTSLSLYDLVVENATLQFSGLELAVAEAPVDDLIPEEEAALFAGLAAFRIGGNESKSQWNLTDSHVTFAAAATAPFARLEVGVLFNETLTPGTADVAYGQVNMTRVTYDEADEDALWALVRVGVVDGLAGEAEAALGVHEGRLRTGDLVVGAAYSTGAGVGAAEKAGLEVEVDGVLTASSHELSVEGAALVGACVDTAEADCDAEGTLVLAQGMSSPNGAGSLHIGVSSGALGNARAKGSVTVAAGDLGPFGELVVGVNDDDESQTSGTVTLVAGMLRASTIQTGDALIVLHHNESSLSANGIECDSFSASEDGETVIRMQTDFAPTFLPGQSFSLVAPLSGATVALSGKLQLHLRFQRVTVSRLEVDFDLGDTLDYPAEEVQFWPAYTRQVSVTPDAGLTVTFEPLAYGPPTLSPAFSSAALPLRHSAALTTTIAALLSLKALL